MAISTIIAAAKLATVVLLLTITSSGFHSSASRLVVTPQSSSEKNTVGGDTPMNHVVRNKETISLPTLVPKRGKGVVTITAQAAAATTSSINGTSSSVQDFCADVCNNYNCAYYHSTLCKPEDLVGRCYVGCHCADMLCHCFCAY